MREGTLRRGPETGSTWQYQDDNTTPTLGAGCGTLFP